MEQGGGQRSGKDYAPRGRYEGRDQSHAQTQKGGSSSPASRTSENKADPWANSKNRSKRWVFVGCNSFISIAGILD